MPRNGSGTYSRNTGVYTGSTAWTQTRDALRKIRVDDHDAHDQDMADAITASLAKNGETTPTANLPMGGFAHTNVADATARTQYAKVSQIQDGTYIYGGVTGGTANAQTLTLAPALTALYNGMRIRFKALNSNTGATTLNVNGIGATPIQLFSATALQGGEIIGGVFYEVIYDSGNVAWILVPADRFLLKRDDTGGAISNTTTETDMLSQSVPAYYLQSQRILRYRAFGMVANSTGSGVDFAFRVKFGGTTYHSVTGVVIGTGASYPIVVEGEIMGVTNTTQRGWAKVNLNASLYTLASNSIAKDITSAQTLAVTGQIGTASASATITTYGATVELV